MQSVRSLTEMGISGIAPRRYSMPPQKSATLGLWTRIVSATVFTKGRTSYCDGRYIHWPDRATLISAHTATPFSAADSPPAGQMSTIDQRGESSLRSRDTRRAIPSNGGHGGTGETARSVGRESRFSSVARAANWPVTVGWRSRSWVLHAHQVHGDLTQ